MSIKENTVSSDLVCFTTYMFVYRLCITSLEAGSRHLGIWLERSLEPLMKIPWYLIPSYFDVEVTGTYFMLLNQVYRCLRKPKAMCHNWNISSD